MYKLWKDIEPLARVVVAFLLGLFTVLIVVFAFLMLLAAILSTWHYIQGGAA